METNSELGLFLSNISGLVTGSNLQAIHDRYLGVLKTMKENQCSLTEAMRRFGVARNTLRDFIGICELRVVDKEKYERVIKEITGKTSVKLIESKCREALSDYRAQSSRLKSEEKLLPFYPKDDFYLGK